MEATLALLAVGVLLSLGGAHATRAGDGHSCDAEGLAARVANSCAAGVATGPCCEAVLAPLDAGSSCICRVAAHSKIASSLNTTGFAAVFNACRVGARTSTAGVARELPRFTEACRHYGVAATQQVGSPATGAGCDPTQLAEDIASSCSAGVSVACCKAVVAAVDIKGCICHVADQREIVISQFSVQDILGLYQDCGGVRDLGVDMECEDVDQGGINNSTCKPAIAPPLSSIIGIEIGIIIISLVIFCTIVAVFLRMNKLRAYAHAILCKAIQIATRQRQREMAGDSTRYPFDDTSPELTDEMEIELQTLLNPPRQART